MDIKSKILIVNGSLGGSMGNTAQLIAALEKPLATSGCDVKCMHLRNKSADAKTRFELESPNTVDHPLKEFWLENLNWADALVFTTGTYWDSWGSPLQIFFEAMTSSEGSASWLGKPAACLVTMHSVGGKGVLARLQSALSSFGALIPPMSGMVYSLVGHEMLRSPAHDESFDRDIWSLDDVDVIARNLISTVEARLNGHLRYQAWPVDRSDPARRWFTLSSK